MSKANDRTIPIRPQLESNVVKFPVGNSRNSHARKPIEVRPFVGSSTSTAENGRLRDARGQAWREAETTRQYWKARLEMARAIESAQSCGLPEGNNHPLHVPGEDRALVANWRQAIAQQMLTPAWNVASVAWKKAALATGQYKYANLKTERAERAIADDVAWLAAHPKRRGRSNSEAMAQSREFKDAMRQRIRDVAMSRDLSDEEIKRALKLKHHEIGHFCKAHGVNPEWLFEGKGRIFEKDAISLNPNMTGSEFAAVVRTMPLAAQRLIEAEARRLVEERGR